MKAGGGDFLATPPSLIASEALRAVRDLAASDGPSVDEIREAAELALARLRFLEQRKRRSQGRKATWLAKVTSFAFPRTFSTGQVLPGCGAQDDLAALRAVARKHHHVCFTVQITAGGKREAAGREIEVQVPVDEALRLGPQIVRIAQSFGPPQPPRAVGAGHRSTPVGRGRMT